MHEGALIIDYEQNVVMSNGSIKLMFGLKKDDSVEWKINDLLRDNEHLLEIYYNVFNGIEERQQIMNTTLITNNENKEDNLLINFRAITITNNKGGSGCILLLFQPVLKSVF